MKVSPKSSRIGKACSNASDIPDENCDGISGGIFAPSLAAGAGFGASLTDWLPGYPLGVVVILGMVAYFTGVVQTPITAFVIVMEMTDNSGLVLPFNGHSLHCPCVLAIGLSGTALWDPGAELYVR